MGWQAADEDEPKPAPKPKNPLDLLPPSTMILDSWKRLYSNSPASNFRETCIAGLWKGGDIPNSPNKEVCQLLHCRMLSYDARNLYMMKYYRVAALELSLAT